jgi:hypothetical protein
MFVFPDTFIRGIREKGWIRQNGTLRTKAYLPNHKPEKPREDGLIGASINWEDNPDVLQFTMNSPYGLYGAAIVKREVLENISRNPQAIDAVCYERDPLLPENPYHGELVFDKNIDDIVEHYVAGQLAQVSDVRRAS